mgnify:FL=1
MNHNPKLNGESFNFGPNHLNDITVMKAVEKLSKKWGTNAKYILEDSNFMHEAKLLRLNCDKANTLLDWQPILNLDQCLNMTIEWYKREMLGKIETLKITELQVQWFINKFCDKKYS